jgi:hypothetical protein
MLAHVQEQFSGARLAGRSRAPVRLIISRSFRPGGALFLLLLAGARFTPEIQLGSGFAI